jgi:acyl-[acyl-carrier-protein]-phospholipid O-acyltransferase/long-chain-fatty-acid--[acyl-carrier-protein] ligase
MSFREVANAPSGDAWNSKLGFTSRGPQNPRFGMKRSFWSLIAVQVQVLLNDNAAKLMLMALGVAVAPELVGRTLKRMTVHGHAIMSATEAGDPELQAKLIKTVLAAVILLPFILFSPIAGWIADRFAKRDVIVLTMWAQFCIMALLLAAVSFHFIPLAVLGLFLLGTQCAIFSPAKQGVIKEIVSPDKIGRAIGVVEVTAIASMLIGGLAGGAMFDLSWTLIGSYWQAAQVTMGVLTVFALAALVVGYQIQPTSAHTNQPFRTELFWEHFAQLRDVWRDPPVRLCVLGIAYFYGLAGALYLTLLEVSAHIHMNGTGTASQTGEYAATLGVGIILGSFLVTRLTTHQVEIGLIPIGSGGLIAGALFAGLTNPAGPLFLLALFSIGVAGALFVVPLNGHLQEMVEPKRRGRILAANNLFVNIFGLIAVIIQYVISAEFGMAPHRQLLLYAAPTAIVTVIILILTPEGLLRLALGLVGRTLYRVTPMGLESLPATGGVLLLPNHISYIDVIVLQLACPRPIRYLVYDDIYQVRLLRWGMRLLGTIPISPRKARAAIEAAVEALARGEVVCLFPEGALTRTATLQKLNRGYEMIARKARVPVMPVWLENVWGSVFSYSGGTFFWKWPRFVPLKVWIHFGAPMTADDATAEVVRRNMLDMSEAAFQARPELRSHLGRECIRSLKRRFFKPIVTDAYANRSLKGGELLGVGITFAQWLRKNVPEKRVGVVLPPGVGATVANLALMLADKVPVNLNFTAGRAANESAIARAGLKRLITAPAMMEQVKDFPWLEERIDLAATLKSFSPRTLKKWGALALVTPAPVLAGWLDLPRVGDREEAALLFTSGSAGEPKGVVLTHRNLTANIAQIGAILAQLELGTILGCLPVFHSFGFTVTLWWPLLGGPHVVTYPSPLDTVKLTEVIYKHRAELLISTPTFLRSFLRKARPEQLRSLRLVVTGAEKLPLDLIAAFEEKFGIKICEGFGMTEASPVVACNLPDAPTSRTNPLGILARRVGSVGRMVPGISIRIRDPETNAERSVFEAGMMWLRGANIFEGYLNDPKRTAEVLHDGWYKTGDVARLDEDGFLFIEGRISRFSKIAGEMVPHLTVEQKIKEVWPASGEDESHGIVVLGVPDEKKGEALVLLTTFPIDPADLRKRMTAAGLPMLWVPKLVRQVDALPVLSTGKLDLRAAQKLAEEAKVAGEGVS